MNGTAQFLGAAPADSHQLKILVIDDDAASIEVMFEVLGHEYEILCATHGAKGIELAIHATPDVILLDIQMDDLDGYEVCARLKADPRTAHIPIIFITGLNSSAQEVMGLEAGAVDFVTKPIDAPVVRARVRTQMRIRRKQGDSLPYEKVAVGTEAQRVFGGSEIASPESTKSIENSALTAELTSRQKEVLLWMCEGKTNWEISRILGTTQDTVKYHAGQIFLRLNVFSRAQAVAKVLS